MFMYRWFDAFFKQKAKTEMRLRTREEPVRSGFLGIDEMETEREELREQPPLDRERLEILPLRGLFGRLFAQIG